MRVQEIDKINSPCIDETQGKSRQLDLDKLKNGHQDKWLNPQLLN